MPCALPRRDSGTLKLNLLSHLVADVLFGGGDLGLLALKLLFFDSHRGVALRQAHFVFFARGGNQRGRERFIELDFRLAAWAADCRFIEDPVPLQHGISGPDGHLRAASLRNLLKDTPDYIRQALSEKNKE